MVFNKKKILIWIMVSTSIKCAVNKRTLNQKIHFHLQEWIAFDKNSVSASRKNCFLLVEISAKILENGFNWQE